MPVKQRKQKQSEQTKSETDDFSSSEEETSKKNYAEVEEFLQTHHNHYHIIRYLDDNDLKLCDTLVDERKDKVAVEKTVLGLLLENTTNVHSLLEKLFDRRLRHRPGEGCSHTNKNINPDHPDHRARIDISDIVHCDEEGDKRTILKELRHGLHTNLSQKIQAYMSQFGLKDVAPRRENPDNLSGLDVLHPLLSHPVVASYLLFNWFHIRRFFVTFTLIYITFLLSFTYHIIHLYHLHDLVFCSSEISIFPDGIIIILGACLILVEVMQMKIFGLNHYLLEPENFVEWITILSAFYSIATKDRASDLQNVTNRAVSSFGIFFGWLQLILVLGRFDFGAGKVSIILYNSLIRIGMYAVSWLLMVVGFSMAFLTVNASHYQGERMANNYTFVQMEWKNLMHSITMSLGEWEFNDFYDKSFNESDGGVIATLLFFVLLLFGSITMVNIFIGVIIGDEETMKASVLRSRLLYMVDQIIVAENLFPKALFDFGSSNYILVCLHTFCGCDPNFGDNKISWSGEENQRKAFQIPGDYASIENSLREKLRVDIVEGIRLE